MAYPNPPVGRLFYEMWTEGPGSTKIGDLPVTACWYRVGDIITIDETGYEVKSIEHILTAEEDWPGPEPPAYDRGFGEATIKIYVN